MLHHARLYSEYKKMQGVELIETGKSGERRLDPPGGEKAGRRKGGHHTLAVLPWEVTRCNTSPATLGTHRSGATRVNHCLLPKGDSTLGGTPGTDSSGVTKAKERTNPTRPRVFQAIHRWPPSGKWPHVSRPVASCCTWSGCPLAKRDKFEHSFSSAVSSILDAENLWTSIERWDDNCTFVISITEESFKPVSQHSPQTRTLLSDFPFFKWFWLAGRDSCFWHSRGDLISFIGDTIIFISGHKVLTFGSCFENESGRHGTYLTMNSDGFITAGMLDFLTVYWSHSYFHCGIGHMGIVVRRHSVHVHLQGLRKYQVYVLCSCCLRMTLGHGTRGTQWLQSHHCVQVNSKILPKKGYWNQKLHLLPKKWREPQGSQRLGGHCLSKRLGAIFDPSRVLSDER